jgi:uncharacterized protein (DUF1684 family)
METMETPAIIALVYIAIGAVFFAHPPVPATPEDFHWRRQLAVFRANLVDVLVWPLTLWERFAR